MRVTSIGNGARRKPRCVTFPHIVATVTFLISLVVASAVGVTTRIGTAWAEDVTRPKIHVLRQDEDWSVLASVPAGRRNGRFDSIKYVPLRNDGLVWASFGGQLRERLEGWNNFGFGGLADSDGVFLLSRLRAHADLHLGNTLRVFAEAKSSLASDRDITGGRRTLDVDELDLQNGFGELTFSAGKLGKLRLRAGRQEMLFGKERLVSPLDWSNTRRSFDGVSGLIRAGGWKATAFFSQLVDIEKYDLNTSNDDVDLFGIYATTRELAGVGGVDVYWLGLDKTMAAFNGDSGGEDRHTLGGRAWGGIADSGLDYDVEVAYQFGEVGSADINAFMLASQVGTVIGGNRRKPRIELGFDYASGDDDASDGDVETFDQLFPLGHAFLGYIDIVGRQNIIDLRGTASAGVLLGSTLKVDLHSFWRASTDDALYNAGGVVVRAGSAGSSRHVGVELDMTLKRAFSPHTLVVFGYHHFFPGDFIDESGASRAIDFLYAQFQYTI